MTFDIVNGGLNIQPAFNSKLAIQIASNGDSIMEKALTGFNKRLIRFVKPDNNKKNLDY